MWGVEQAGKSQRQKGQRWAVGGLGSVDDYRPHCLRRDFDRDGKESVVTHISIFKTGVGQ